MRTWLDRLKRWARAIRRDAVALNLATRDPRVPWYAKVLAALIAAYALSPIDLIPDFIPVLGYLDEVILPLAIAGVVRLIEPAIMAEHRAAATRIVERPVRKSGAALVLSGLGLRLFWSGNFGRGDAIQVGFITCAPADAEPR